MTQAAIGRVQLPASLTSFASREHETSQLIRLLQDYRLVTITGPGGVGKTRLAVEAARAVAGQFPDGVHFVELSAITDENRVAAQVAAILGVRQAPGASAPERLAAALAAQRLLLVLDNCEHVLTAVAELCEELLEAADDVRVLATSREQLWVSGETRYRLCPLELPGSGDLAEVARSAAVALFAERVQLADPGFSLDPESVALAARVVAHLDGMPLAIELAAARVEALGLQGLADRIDDALQLLNGARARPADRHKSLSEVAEWSYRLLSPPEQRVFRQLAVFPGPFTLEAAEAVAGTGTGTVLLRLVDCSLVAPPQPGPDQRMRYALLQVLRSYGLDRLEEAGEKRETSAALARFALTVAEQAAAGLETRDHEVPAARWLEAEDATLGQAVDWTVKNAPDSALPLATALAPWWWLRGSAGTDYARLAAAAEQASPASTSWARAQLWLGHLAQIANPDACLDHYAAAHHAGSAPIRADALVGRAVRNVDYGQLAEAGQDARRALSLAREAGYPAGEAMALTILSCTARGANARPYALDWALQAEEALRAGIPGWMDRWCRTALTRVMTTAGELDFARRVCGDGLARSREMNDLRDLPNRLMALTSLERLSGNREGASAYLHEAVVISARLGDHIGLYSCVQEGGFLCAERGQLAEAVTLWAVQAANSSRTGLSAPAQKDHARLAGRALPASQARAAAERGARMTLAAAAGLVTLLTAPGEDETTRAAGELTDRERELVTLVAQGLTNAEIAAQLFISIRTVSSHLDRIREKTGYRRRADLTRLALREGLV